ncbi:hypothetical protein EB796_023283 [Bugula neritina]|uniref:Peptidase M14 domain-containing protein n=1 Tax=Bugula neritina TaxID=10212 RepID=A0A7J7IXZ8_BUGNE|nr:hypothetical protein EB796_023283 [Bugula neritina]
MEVFAQVFKLLLYLSGTLNTIAAYEDVQRKDVSDMNVISVNLPSIYAQKDLLRNITQQPNIHILSVLKNLTVALIVKDSIMNKTLDVIQQYSPGLNNITITRVPDIPITDGWTLRARKRRSLHDFRLESYNTYDSIMEYLDELAAAHPQLCQTEVIGSSYEGRDIKVIKLHGLTGKSGVRVFIEGTQHAREWISPAAIIYMIQQMVKGYTEKDSWTVQLLDKYEFHFLPVMNPDGYEYTYSSSQTRFWRKNRKVIYNGTRCIGVDLNRNWGFHWSGLGGSKWLCSELYRGKSEFSESETRSTAEYINRYNGTWHSYFSFHSYGQLILFPWSHSDIDSPDYHYHASAAHEFAEGLSQLNNITYQTGSVTDLLYIASGSSESWAYGSARIPYAYTIELPSTSFVLPRERIAPTAMELLDGFRYYFKHIEKSRPNLYEILHAADQDYISPSELTSTESFSTWSTTPELTQSNLLGTMPSVSTFSKQDDESSTFTTSEPTLFSSSSIIKQYSTTAKTFKTQTATVNQHSSTTQSKTVKPNPSTPIQYSSTLGKRFSKQYDTVSSTLTSSRNTTYVNESSQSTSTQVSIKYANKQKAVQYNSSHHSLTDFISFSIFIFILNTCT